MCTSKDHFNARNRERRQRRLIEEALEAGKSVVVDNTNATPADRAALIQIGRQHGAKIVAYSFETTVADARERNDQREGAARVPVVALYTTAKRLVPPSWEEGYNELYRVRISDAGFDVEPWERDEPERA